MSIDISTTAGSKSNSSKGSSLYETKTLLCKNKCGYYGNSIQYDGYCSICYRKLKNNKQLNQSSSSSNFNNNKSSFAFDDTSSLLASSQSFNNPFSFNDEKINNNQIWNEHTNLNKFSSKKEKTSRASTFKLFRRQQQQQTASTSNQALNGNGPLTIATLNQVNNNNNQPPSSPLNLVETVVNKVADKAVNLVDQSIQNINNSSFLSFSNENNIIDFYNSLNKLTNSSSSSSSNNPNSNSNNNLSLLNNSNINSTNIALIEFEDQFRINFPQLNQDLSKQMKQFVDKFLDAFKRKDQSIANNNKQFEIVQEFYKKIYKYIQTSASIKSYLDKLNAILINNNNNSNDSINSFMNNSSSDQQQHQLQQNANDDTDKLHEGIMIMVESYINNNIYDFVFPSIMTEFEEQDMNLQKRIRDFYWITNEMIGTCIDENSIFYRDSYEEALNYIVEMDSKRSCYEKMLCITECSKNIYKAINISVNVMRNINEVTSSSAISSPINPNISLTNNKSEFELNLNDDVSSNEMTADKNTIKTTSKTLASADDYLPAFIYIVLKTNPTMLYSNINFISRFAFEKRILQGEHAYHFCSLNAIISHIENLNAEHLNMSQEQFENYCNGLMDINSSSNVLKIIQSNLKILSELKDKQKLLKQETLKLQTDIDLFRKSMQNKFNACLFNNKEQYTKNINGFKKNFLDDNQDLLVLNESKLTEPLKPSQLLDLNLNANYNNVKNENT